MCPRISSHLHYSAVHDLFVKLGLIAFILAEVVAFASGAVVGWTHLRFDYSTIASYESVAKTIDQLIAPYQYIRNISYILEFGTLGLAIVAAVTLHSVSKKKLHRFALSVAFMLSLLTILAKYYHYSLMTQALSTLPNLVDPATLSTYIQVEQQFETAYGLLGGPASSIVGILLILSVGMLGVASLTPKVLLVWNRPKASQQEASTLEPSALTVATNNESKYCRYCRAKIPLQSKFCEECGKALV